MTVKDRMWILYSPQALSSTIRARSARELLIQRMADLPGNIAKIF